MSSEAFRRRCALRLHRRAERVNEILERSATCGNSEAIAQSGIAYCHGWGVVVDRRRGLSMMRRAYTGGAPLTPDWSSIRMSPRCASSEMGGARRVHASPNILADEYRFHPIDMFR